MIRTKKPEGNNPVYTIDFLMEDKPGLCFAILFSLITMHDNDGVTYDEGDGAIHSPDMSNNKSAAAPKDDNNLENFDTTDSINEGDVRRVYENVFNIGSQLFGYFSDANHDDKIEFDRNYLLVFYITLKRFSNIEINEASLQLAQKVYKDDDIEINLEEMEKMFANAHKVVRFYINNIHTLFSHLNEIAFLMHAEPQGDVVLDVDPNLLKN